MSLLSVKFKKIIVRMCSGMIFVFTWYFLIKLFNIPEYLLPSPFIVIQELIHNFPSYLQHLKVTGMEALVGFVFGNIIAIISGLILFRFQRIMHLFMPAVTALQAIPIVAIAPLFIVWLGSGVASKIVMAATISFFPTLAAILSSFAEVDHNAQQLFRLYQSNYLKTVRYLLFPSALPSIVTGLKVSAGLATVGAIVAEMTGADAGVGYLILNASYRMETVKLFVGILLAGALGIMGFALPNVLRSFYPQAWVGTRTGEMQ